MITVILKSILKFVADPCFDNINLSDDNRSINVVIINVVEPTEEPRICSLDLASNSLSKYIWKCEAPRREN